MSISLDMQRRRFSLAALGATVLFPASAVAKQACGPKARAGDPAAIFSFDPASGRFPEGMAISPTGNIYLGVQPTGEIVRLRVDGQFSIVADLDQGFGFMLGLALDGRGNLYAALDSFVPATHGVWKIDPGGTASLLAAMPTSSLPNELAFDLDGNLYVSDTFLGAVWKRSASGAFQVWLASPLLQGTGDLFGVPAGANGLAFFEEDDGSTSLYVANTDKGTIVRIPILADGSAAVPTVFAQHESLVSADGVKFDTKGNLYVAVNFTGTLVRVDRCGSVETLVQGLDRPASLAFGTGDGEKKALYVTNFGFASGKHLVRVDVGMRGLPLP
jgi:sugar lactone lactonase YvrE